MTFSAVVASPAFSRNWHALYQAALFETDRSKMQERIVKPKPSFSE